MLYDYRCSLCEKEYSDVTQSIHDEPLTNCPHCGKEGLQRVPCGGLGAFVKDSKTIGQIADKNWSSMGSYKRSEIEAKNKDSLKAKEKKDHRSKLNQMTDKQRERYIITGEQ